MAAQLDINSTLPLPNSQVRIPQLGFGIYLSPAKICEKSCLAALSHGYRHIDSAQYYENEAQMGEAVRKSGIPRSSVFLTTKILGAGGSVDKSYQKCIESIDKIDGKDGYVDLFLIHSPNAGRAARREMWLALEKVYKEGRAKAIGVSNFGVGHIEELKGLEGGVESRQGVWPPTVNQIELHPWCQQSVTTAYCKKNNIIIEAYSPLVRNNKAYDPTLVSIAEAHKKSTTQVLIRYCLQKGWVPLPKSDTPERIAANAQVYDFELTDKDMKTLDGLDEEEQGSIVQWVDNSDPPSK